MAQNDSVTRFITEAGQLLTEQGWSSVDDAAAPFNLIMTSEKTTLVVHARTVLFFIAADDLSPEEMDHAMERVHAMTGETATAPLFPATAVVVFVFSDAMPPDALPEKRRDVAESRVTVAWVAHVATGRLDIHRGTPLVRSGRRELEQALHAMAGTG